MAVHAHCVLGTSDLALASLDLEQVAAHDEHEKKQLERVKQVRGQLGGPVVEALGKLPRSFRMDTEDGSEIVLVHGSPADPHTVITHDMSDEEIESLLDGESNCLVLCGGSHVPFDRTVNDVRVVGLGSVGEAPTPGVMHVTIVDTSSAGATVLPLSVVIKPPELSH